MARRAINGLRVIVTGASSGIGRALVIALVERGARVVAMARRRERLDELAAELSAGERLLCVAGDVTSPADRAAVLASCESRFGGLDCLVNNAGIGGLGPFAEAGPDRLRRIMEVNLFAAAEFTREALPLLRRGRAPLIVNVGSVLGHVAVPGKSEYCASKFALHGLSDALRIELGREGIDVLLVSPSTTSSEFFDRAGEDSSPPAGDERARDKGASDKRRSTSLRGAMTPTAVARRIVTAIERGRREIILSAGGNALVWLDRLCPPLASWILKRWG
jgi:short-subunit dehydrogenase